METLVWLSTIKQYVVIVPTTLLSRHAYYDTIHRRCYHVSAGTIRKMSTLGIKGIPINYIHASRDFCRLCVVAKSIVANINRESTRANDPDTYISTKDILKTYHFEASE